MHPTINVSTCGDLGRERHARAEAAPLKIVADGGSFDAHAELIEELGEMTLHLAPKKRKRRAKT